ncbi:hypothetical protein [Novilysobacter spongiicola]|nr:hypothetical protein [Lysobacter spongiicola]
MLALASTACSTRAVRTDVDYAMVLPPFAERTRLQQDDVFLMAAPIESPLPLFPGDVDPHELAGAVSVCIELVVDEHGEVSSIEPLDIGSSCTDVSGYPGSSFLREVTGAVARWSFIAAAICTPAENDGEDCESPEAMVRAIPVKLSYMFAFTRDGEVGGVTSPRSVMR